MSTRAFVTKTPIIMKKLIFGVCPCAQESKVGENHLYKTHAVNTLMYLSYHLLCVPKDGSIIFWNSFEVENNHDIIKWKIAFLQNAETQYHQQCITHWKCQMSLEPWAKWAFSCKCYRAWALCGQKCPIS